MQSLQVQTYLKQMLLEHLNATTGAITSAMASGDGVQLTGFGSFVVRSRAARTGRNPQTGATIQIKASNVAAFKAGKALKDACN